MKKGIMSSRIIINLVAQIKMFFRSPGSVFWTVAFPVLLILLFGAIFSGTGTTKYNLYVQDLDGTPISQEFVSALNNTGVLIINEVDPEEDADEYIRANSIASFLTIPQGFSTSFLPEPERQNSTLVLRVDNSSSSSGAVVHIINSVYQSLNQEMAGG